MLIFLWSNYVLTDGPLKYFFCTRCKSESMFEFEKISFFFRTCNPKFSFTILFRHYKNYIYVYEGIPPTPSNFTWIHLTNIRWIHFSKYICNLNMDKNYWQQLSHFFSLFHPTLFDIISLEMNGGIKAWSRYINLKMRF